MLAFRSGGAHYPARVWRMLQPARLLKGLPIHSSGGSWAVSVSVRASGLAQESAEFKPGSLFVGELGARE